MWVIPRGRFPVIAPAIGIRVHQDVDLHREALRGEKQVRFAELAQEDEEGRTFVAQWH